MEEDNCSEEESFDYSCSPVTKNELLTAAKYRAVKYAIVLLAPAISIPLFHFICSKPFKQTSSCSPSAIESAGNREWKKILPFPATRLHFPLGVSISLRFHSFPFLSLRAHCVFPTSHFSFFSLSYFFLCSFKIVFFMIYVYVYISPLIFTKYF